MQVAIFRPITSPSYLLRYLTPGPPTGKMCWPSPARSPRACRPYLDQTAELADISSLDITAAARTAIAELDEFNGGFGDGLKFPRESFLLFLLDQAARHGATDLLHAVTLTLDGMLRGGVHDQIGGGFHRYAVDPEWLTPHFEKMLYNQALMGRVLLRAYALTGNPGYARAARRTLDYVLRDMRSGDAVFFSAQDADTVLSSGEREEGLYYTWTPDEIAAALGDQAAPMITALNAVEQGLFEGRNIPNFGQSPLETAALLGLSPSEFDARLETLRQARAARVAPIRDEKIILSWNAEMVATLAEAATILNEPDYLAAARAAGNGLLKRFQTDTGLKRVHFQGRTDTPAQLTDYATLGNAMLALYDHGADGTPWLQRAETYGQTMQRLFADPGRPLRLTAQPDGLGPFRPLDDTELASGNALALSFLAGLDRRQARLGDAAPRLAASLVGDAVQLPGMRSGILTAVEESRFGPSGPLRISSGGAVNVISHADRDRGQVSLTISLRPGWHLNAHEPLEDYLIGVTLDAGGQILPASDYPDPVIRNLGFSENPLALYERDFTLTAPLTISDDTPQRITLTLQACNDEQCLPPDDMVFWVWPRAPQ